MILLYSYYTLGLFVRVFSPTLEAPPNKKDRRETSKKYSHTHLPTNPLSIYRQERVSERVPFFISMRSHKNWVNGNRIIASLWDSIAIQKNCYLIQSITLWIQNTLCDILQHSYISFITKQFFPSFCKMTFCNICELTFPCWWVLQNWANVLFSNPFFSTSTYNSLSSPPNLQKLFDTA